MKNIKANSLIREKSPYLLQHAHNPVNWLPWGDEAFNKAINEDKPIFLSIGYSTCHWCHVMEKESFEDEVVAEILNNNFVPVKVDREERPDIDNIYMKVCQLITGSGGWPLSVFLTPSKKPFFAGTYFPKENKYGRIGFKELLHRINEIWKEKKSELINSAEDISASLLNTSAAVMPAKNGIDIIHDTFNSLKKYYDSENGGFGSAPKFPSPHNLLFLLRYNRYYGNTSAFKIVENTLTQMRCGGIFDQVGFGFHRYSTDNKWLVPHFEKMLYDQAMLIIAYSEAYQTSKNDLFKTTVNEIIEYVKTNLISPEGGFYSAEDADSDGEEGKFYVWSSNEIYDLLSTDEANLFCNTYNITRQGNFKDEHSGTFNGTNIPHLKVPAFKNDKLNIIKQKLIEERNKRIHPFKDDKILTDWNGLMIAALSTAAKVFDNDEYLSLAIKCRNFIYSKMLDRNGGLNHRYRNNESGIQANLDDYSFLIWGLLSLYNSTYNEQFLIDAINLCDTTVATFWDYVNGGFYFAPAANNDLILRTKEYYDGAIPSGNSVMLHNLIVLSKITADTKYDKFIDYMVQHLSMIAGSSFSYTFSVSSYMLLLEESYELVIVGDSSNPQTLNSIKKINQHFVPGLITIFKESAVDSKIEYLNNYKMKNGQTTFYLCRNRECDAPTNDIQKIIKQIS